ncbi:uncharacterized protein LOC135947892 isoform X2 [Cloeon dipterum]|uniref:uncharacterized protein LOC135947892 isoform X2 n=1 Tax=Cloeon dipterum TaxID=197152 RepID=UPI00321FD5E9
MRGKDSENMVRRSPAVRSLQDSAINTIVKNIGGYRDLITKKISPPMRKILFDEAMERIKEIGEDQVWAALPYLDQHRTTESFSTKVFATIFHLEGKKGDISEACVSMEEFLQYLAKFVPMLQELDIEDPRMPWNKRIYKKIQLQPLATDLLLKMENLTNVSIFDVYIKFSGFASVCEESQNLQAIEANHILVDIEPKSIKKLLKTLDSKFDHQAYDAMKYPRKIGITLKKTNADNPFREATVSLSNDLHDLFPFLTTLDITGQKDKDLGDDDMQSERNRLLRILRREGGTLKILILDYVRPELKITFKDIFEHCYELEILEIHHSNVLEDESITSFGRLKEFIWDKTFHDGETISLDGVSSAPLLQKIDIVADKFGMGIKESLLCRIRNRTILTNLTELYIMEFSPDQKDLHELARVLRTLGVHVNLQCLF